MCLDKLFSLHIKFQLLTHISLALFKCTDLTQFNYFVLNTSYHFYWQIIPKLTIILFCNGRNVLHLPIVDRKEKGRKQEEERMLNNEKLNEIQNGYLHTGMKLHESTVLYCTNQRFYYIKTLSHKGGSTFGECQTEKIMKTQSKTNRNSTK